MSTTSLLASEVMNRSAALLNDPARTDYTYTAQLPYLNMAIDELLEILQESNASPTNLTTAAIVVPVGSYQITPIESVDLPHYPYDLVEIQEVAERNSGTTDSYVTLGRREFMDSFPATSSLMFWCWENQIIKFNPNGATTEREVQLRYVRQAVQLATDETSQIGTIGSRSFLSYRTASLCALFVGENESRASVLNDQAQQSMERMLGINSKGRQQIVTRRRPFRASYKSRGWI